MTGTTLPADTPSELGASHTALVHHVFDTAKRMLHDTWESAIWAGDDRIASYSESHLSVQAHALEVNEVAVQFYDLDGDGMRGLLAALHGSNLASLHVLRSRVLAGLAVAAGDDMPDSHVASGAWAETDLTDVPASRLGEMYADSTFWALGALHGLLAVAARVGRDDASPSSWSLDPVEARTRDLANARHSIEMFAQHCRRLRAVAAQWDRLDEAGLCVMFYDFQETTASRLASFVGSMGRRLRPLRPRPADTTVSADTDPSHPVPATDAEGPGGLEEAFDWGSPPAGTTDTPLDPPHGKHVADEGPAWAGYDSPYEMGETHAAVYAFGLAAVRTHLDKARAELAHLTDMGAALDRMTEAERLNFLLGLHHHAVGRLHSGIQFAQRLLAPPEANDRSYATGTPPEGAPTHADVVAGRHNGVRWVVPLSKRYPDDATHPAPTPSSRGAGA